MKNFIWLDKANYPNRQKANHTVFADKKNFTYTVAAFSKKHSFKKNISECTVNIFAENRYHMYINNEFCGTGPVCPGGDYGITKPMPTQYFNTYTINNIGNDLSFYILVQLLPDVMCDVSAGVGGLCLEYEITFDDGEKRTFSTDETWECRIETPYIDDQHIDFTFSSTKWEFAKKQLSVWNLKKSPIKNLEETKIMPTEIIYSDDDTVKVLFDKIYSGYLCLNFEADGEFEFIAEPYEFGTKRYRKYFIKGKDSVNMRFLRLESVGEIDFFQMKGIKINDIYLMFSHYPIECEGNFSCSDTMLNSIYATGKHTTDICRQTIELDSPAHQENLGCTGDYFIESLISYYSFGDYSLSRFDIIRTADYMRMTNAKMFHTSYSLIWIFMLYDYYMHSGDLNILTETFDVVSALAERFDSYIGKNGVIENPPDYMFIDWVEIDGFSMHHPPKALGQSALTAFYYNALNISAKLATVLNKSDIADIYSSRAENLKKAFNKCFYDADTGLYVSGLNTPDEGDDWRPKNPHNKRYFTKYANILAVLYDLCDNGKELMEKTLRISNTPDIQPYFMHFLLEALYKCGLFEKYGLETIHKWDSIVSECPKGMKEAWGSECQGYGYDYSHAWSAAPSYHLPSKLAGLKILSPGFRKISLSPCLYGLDYADIKIPTPLGLIQLKLKNTVEILLPDGIELIKD